jgi:hypothetical protein
MYLGPTYHKLSSFLKKYIMMERDDVIDITTITSTNAGGRMRKKEIDQMVKDIKKATLEACKSKESAQKFLMDAGILKTKKMKTYRKIATVQAKLFEEGDEDGFISRYYGLVGEHEIKVPYVSTLENQKHLSHGFGREYLCVGIKGERWLVDKDIFESTYELIN